jgi:thioester reductase-like protein
MFMRAPEHRPGIVLTGATGFLGGEVLARLLERGEGPIYALVRARSDEEATARLRATIAALMGRAEPWSHLTVAIPADLTAPGLGLDDRRRAWLAEQAGLIIHSAASVSFTLPLDEARTINVDGTRRLLDLAEVSAAAGGLRCFTHVSTAYVAGTHRGAFGEDDVDVGQDFRNTYERSKFEAEQLVWDRSGSVPVQVLRPSIVVGDSRTGWTPAFNVLYWPLRAFARGSYPAVPARRRTPVDVVPVDFVANACLALAGRPGTTYHLTAGNQTSTVGELVRLASGYLGRRAPRLVPPRLYRRVLHPLLVRTGSQRRRRALRRSEVFFPYFSMGTRYDTAQTRPALAAMGIEAPPLSAYFEQLMDFAVAARWGRRPAARHEAGALSRPVARSRQRARRGRAHPSPA